MKVKAMRKHIETFLTRRLSSTPRWQRWIQDSLCALAGVALITVIIMLAHFLPKAQTSSLLYLLMVLILATTRGLYAASMASLLSVLTSDFFFFPPSYTLALVKIEDLLTLAVFLVAAVITSQLAAALRQRAEQAQKREIELRKLYEKAQELASLQERQRLARELHDSVSQALYGISLGAHTALEALETDLPQTRASLEYVISLVDASQVEMRALIFELRPESLQTEGLIAALSKQGAVLQTRHHLQVEMQLIEEPTLSLECKHTLYRIAQEALHNIVKHARATHVWIALRRETHVLSFSIQDDGKGFNQAETIPGHFGVRTMQERTTNIGGRFFLHSSPDAGTVIEITIPLLSKEYIDSPTHA
jgi:signal transduction histidine kinase